MVDRLGLDTGNTVAWSLPFGQLSFSGMVSVVTKRSLFNEGGGGESDTTCD